MLSTEEISVLKKGLKFTPSTSGSYFDVKLGLEQFTRRLKIRERFRNREYKDISLVKGKSKMEIPTNNMELYQLVNNIENLEP